MNEPLQKNHPLLQQRLNHLAWPIKCYWAKHFPIKIITTEPIDVAAIDFEQVYVHPMLAQFNDDVLFCVLAHEWAHRMVSPTSIDIGNRIIEAVAAALHIDFELAQLVSGPAIELIVDRSNCEIKLWQHRYRTGFSDSFTFFSDKLKKETQASKNIDLDMLTLQQMMLALRMSNVAPTQLPEFIRHLEGDARALIDLLFEDWYGRTDPHGQDHIGKIIRFSKAFYKTLPHELLTQRQQLRTLFSQLRDLMDGLVALSNGGENGNRKTHRTDTTTEIINVTSRQIRKFDIRLTRQVTDHLLKQAHKPRQTTGLWQPGHAFASLDIKRSFRSSPRLIAGMTTHRKTDSAHILHSEHGKQLRFCLIVDDSGSMSGDEARLSRSICEGINRFAAQKDLYIGLITFGSTIDISIQPDRRYQWLTKALAKLDGNLGGTNLQPALKRLALHIESDRHITHAMLITDASFSDWEDCQKPLSEILEQINMTVLLINCNPPDHVLKSIRERRHSINFFKIDPSEEVNIAFVQEMMQ